MQGPITRLRRVLLASFLQEPVSAAPGQADRKGSGRSNRGRKKQLSCQLGLAWHFGVVPVEHRGLPLILNTFNLFNSVLPAKSPWARPRLVSGHVPPLFQRQATALGPLRSFPQNLCHLPDLEPRRWDPY